MPLSLALNEVLLNNLTTSVIFLNQNLEVTYINPAAEIMLSTSYQRCLNLSVQEIVSEQSRDITLEEALKKGHPCTKLDALLITHNNRHILADYVITPIPLKQQVYYLIEIKVLDFLRISKEEMILSQQEGNKLLLRGLAHEIKNPLGGIRGAAQLLDRALPDDTFKEYTNIFIEEADRLCNLVDRMLGSNKPPLFQKTNIHEVLERVYHLIAAESQGNIQLIKDYDPSIPDLSIDAEQMIQALLNITRNAFEALTEAAIQAPEITLRTRIVRQFTIGSVRHRLVLKVEVIDNGPGIPEHIKDTLFYPMVSGRPEGKGLGLSITQNIITLHKGIIECQSQAGNTKFTLSFPLE